MSAKIPKARVIGGRKRIAMNEKTQERMMTVLMTGMVIAGFIAFTSQVRQCLTDKSKAIADCISAGGDAYKCCHSMSSGPGGCGRYGGQK